LSVTAQFPSPKKAARRSSGHGGRTRACAPSGNARGYATVRNAQGELLLIERTDNGLWALPGGAQDIGESVVQAAQREVNEETGVDVEVTGLSGIYSDPQHVIAYDDGEVRQEFSLCFHAKPVGGELRSSSESKEARWVSPDSLQDLKIHPSMRLRINHALKREPQPYLG
jgi:ADP-ribose pyrophosphatase YjhB (NUDIX family)